MVDAARPILAGILPPLAWVSFSPTARRNPLHLLTVAGIVLLLFFWIRLLDPTLAAIYVGYGVALLRLAFQGPDAFSDVRLGQAESVRRAAMAAGLLLLSLAAVDLLVAVDLRFDRGANAASIVGAANVVIIVLAAFAIVSVGDSRPAATGEFGATREAAPPQVTSNDREIAARIDTLMREKQLFRDPDLTLQRLARRVGIPRAPDFRRAKPSPWPQRLAGREQLPNRDGATSARRDRRVGNRYRV